TALVPFVNALKSYHPNSALINFSEGLEINKSYSAGKLQQSNEIARLAENFKLKEENWRKLSYSFLARKSPYVQKPSAHTDLKDYEYFIFKQLIRGNITGNLIHHILENIDFSTEQYWHKHVHAALARFMPKQLDNYK